MPCGSFHRPRWSAARSSLAYDGRMDAADTATAVDHVRNVFRSPGRLKRTDLRCLFVLDTLAAVYAACTSLPDGLRRLSAAPVVSVVMGARTLACAVVGVEGEPAGGRVRFARRAAAPQATDKSLVLRNGSALHAVQALLNAVCAQAGAADATNLEDLFNKRIADPVREEVLRRAFVTCGKKVDSARRGQQVRATASKLVAPYLNTSLHGQFVTVTPHELGLNDSTTEFDVSKWFSVTFAPELARNLRAALDTLPSASRTYAVVVAGAWARQATVVDVFKGREVCSCSGGSTVC
jgi:hypothetical protein